jgi:hypothetical protein
MGLKLAVLALAGITENVSLARNRFNSRVPTGKSANHGEPAVLVKGGQPGRPRKTLPAHLVEKQNSKLALPTSKRANHGETAVLVKAGKLGMKQQTLPAHLVMAPRNSKLALPTRRCANHGETVVLVKGGQTGRPRKTLPAQLVRKENSKIKTLITVLRARSARVDNMSMSLGVLRANLVCLESFLSGGTRKRNTILTATVLNALKESTKLLQELRNVRVANKDNFIAKKVKHKIPLANPATKASMKMDREQIAWTAPQEK